MSADEIKQIMKMLRAIANTQSALRQDLLETKKELGAKIDKNGKRIDMLGKQLNELDEDAPTGQEFRSLEKRVTKVETKLASV